MADVRTAIEDWSVTASSNLPADATSIGAGLADNLQQIQTTVRTAYSHKGADIASGTTTDIGAIVGAYHDITGTTTITGLGTVSAGIRKVLQFDGALILTHDGTALIIPGGANITTVAGDQCEVMSLGSGNWIMLWYTRGAALGEPPFSDSLSMVKGSADATKLLLFDVDTNVKTGTTNTVAVGAAQILQPGILLPYAGSSIPTGTLLCDGTTGLSTTANPEYTGLFTAIGTTWGGTGATDFDLPDLRGRTLIGDGTGAGLTARTLGDISLGAETHQLTEDEMPAHTHSMENNVTAVNEGSAQATGSGVWGRNAVTDSTGGDAVHENMQPSGVVKYVITY